MLYQDLTQNRYCYIWTQNIADSWSASAAIRQHRKWRSLVAQAMKGAMELSRMKSAQKGVGAIALK